MARAFTIDIQARWRADLRDAQSKHALMHHCMAIYQVAALHPASRMTFREAVYMGKMISHHMEQSRAAYNFARGTMRQLGLWSIAGDRYG
jgi:hypothetical protein